MKTRISIQLLRPFAVAVLCTAFSASAQVPVDDQGKPLGNYQGAVDTGIAAGQDNTAVGNDGIPLLSSTELEELVGPVALYPDDLLAIVLPASTYPLQVVQAARFLADLENDPSLEPNPEWDDSVIALVNYPEVVELLNDDLDWTWRLGEAVVAQQNDVINAVEEFRDRAYAAGNLKSDDYQTVSRDEGVIEITPVNEEIIYVPYYEPERVVYYQPRPVYYYYPRAYPVYYYPYPSHYAFNRGYFWGVTTAFTIGWRSDHLHVFHHSYHGHPYYGRSYYDRWWYRRPDIHAHNNVYIRNNVNISVNHYSNGDYWRPSRNTRLRSSDQRITRNTHYPNRRTTTNTTSINRTINSRRDGDTVTRGNTRTYGEVNQRQSGATRQRSQDDMRRTIATVQQERRANGQGNRTLRTRDAVETSAREPRQRQTNDRTTGQRELSEQRATQRQSQNRSSSERVPDRATTQRQTATRQAARQEHSQPRQSVQRQTPQRQAQRSEHQVIQRQPEHSQRQTTQRQPERSVRQTTQRQPERSVRQTTQRQPERSQRQTTPRQPERSERQVQSNTRKPDQSNAGRSQSSSDKSRSARADNRRHTR